MPLKVGMTKSEIEKEIAGKGSYIQIDWLNRYLRENHELTMEMKKFVYQKLADIYEKSGMFKESARMYDNMANLSLTFNEKINYHVKGIAVSIKGGDSFGADEAMKKAVGQANSMQREQIYQDTIKMYKAQGEFYEKNMKRANAVVMYEKLLQMRLVNSEREFVKGKLRDLYEKLGKTRELRDLDRSAIVTSKPEDMKPMHSRLPSNQMAAQRQSSMARSQQVAPKRQGTEVSNDDFDIDKLF